MNSRLLAPVFVLGLAYIAYAGSGGIAPTDGSHKIRRTDPLPATDVGDGTFGTNSSERKTLHLNPEQGSSSDWTKGTDGMYKENGSTNLRRICIHAIDGEWDYQDKIDGVVTSSGLVT